MKTLNTLSAILLLSNSLLLAYDEGASSPYTTKFGDNAGVNNTGVYNVFTGAYSGHLNTSGRYNDFSGYKSGSKNTSGEKNLFSGAFSGFKNTTGSRNVFSGIYSALNHTTGNNNIFLGAYSGYNADINSSILLGYQAGYNATRDNTLYIANSDTDTPLIYGEFDTGFLKVNGDLNVTAPVSAAFTGSHDAGNLSMFNISVNNTNTDKKSDVGFSLFNARGAEGEEPFKWTFRTWEPDSGFAISKVGTGSKELRLYDTDPTDATTVVLELANGAYCDGVWHDASSRTLKQDIQPLEGDAALEAFRQLKPVTYAYKAQPHDAKVGFIAEDVPELVADPKHRSLSAMDMVALLTKVLQEQDKDMMEKDAEIQALKTESNVMQNRLEKVESLLHTLFPN